MPDPTPDDEEKALQKIRNTHTAWDRKRREFQHCLKQSNQNEMTKGTRMEALLAEILAAGDATDELLQTFEIGYEPHKPTNDQWKTEADRCKELVEKMKQGQTNLCPSVRG